MDKGIQYWMPLGAGLGLLAGTMSEDTNTGVGIAIGAAVGLVLGTAMTKKASDDNLSNDSSLDVDTINEE